MWVVVFVIFTTTGAFRNRPRVSGLDFLSAAPVLSRVPANSHGPTCNNDISRETTLAIFFCSVVTDLEGAPASVGLRKQSTHDAYENTWKCGELKLYFSPSAGG